VEPTWSKSMVISASSASVESLITAALAAVVLVFSEASIDNFVLSIVDPPSLMSMMIVEPVGAVVTDARTAVTVTAQGMRNVALAVPVVIAVVSSEAAIPISIGDPTRSVLAASRLVLAAAAELAPVPPSATGTSVPPAL
jgi:hypothetical protein